MKANVGPVDATIRGTLALIFFGLAIAFNSAPVIALLAALVALVMAATALTKVCPLYRILGWATTRRGQSEEPSEKPAR